ncbi:MAG: ATP-dependent DNA ligase [Ilumatobacteraceae bacterium]
MLFEEVAQTSQVVSATTKRSEKVEALALLLAGAAPDEIESTVAFGVGAAPQGRIGVGWATIRDVRPAPATQPTLAVGDVDRAIGAIAAVSGPGSLAHRRRLLDDLLRRATEPEQRLIRSILGGELRQGALDGVMAAAVAKAARVKVADVQRASMFAGSLSCAARVALVEGLDGLQAIALTPTRPVQPMLASAAADVAEALATTGEASVEWKLDGARVQAHRSGGEVRLFTRNLNEVTDRLGGVVEVVSALPGGDLVLDGEVLGVDEAGSPRRFQDTMGDFGADHGAERGSGLQAFFFDVLHAGSSVVDEPLVVRREILADIVPETSRLPSIVTADPTEAQRFLDRSIAAGHEGVMVKQIGSTYDAGRRGGAWRKVKPVHTLDLVVLAVEWGHGRRHGWLSNLHLGARGADGGFVMVGKTFKGLTDDLLRWQTERFLGLRIGDGTGEEAHVVHVQPVQVVEIAVDGVQVSTRYPGGVALRFARVRQYRADKLSADADTIEQVRALLR